jgi:hypothetical protein
MMNANELSNNCTGGNNNNNNNDNDNDNDNENENENENEKEIIIIQHELCLLSKSSSNSNSKSISKSKSSNNDNDNDNDEDNNTSNSNSASASSSSLLLNENGENWLRVLFNNTSNNKSTTTTRTQTQTTSQSQFLLATQQAVQEVQQQLQGTSTQHKTQIQIDDEGNCNDDDGNRILLTPQGYTQYLKTQPDLTQDESKESQLFQNESQLSQQSQSQVETGDRLFTSAINKESIELITNGTGLSPPNEEESIYLCFEIIEAEAHTTKPSSSKSKSSTSSFLLTVKDMRPPLPFRGKLDKVASSIIVAGDTAATTTTTATVITTTTTKTIKNNHEEDDDGNDGSSDDDDDVCIYDSVKKQWKALPRRKLTVLNPNDRISITTSTTKNGIVFEYQQISGTVVEQEQRRNSAAALRNNYHLNSVGVVAGTTISNSSRAIATTVAAVKGSNNNNEADNADDDAVMDDKSRSSNSSNSTVESKNNDFDYGDINNNINTTYYGTTTIKTKSSGGGVGSVFLLQSQQQQSQPSQPSQQYSVAVDSVVNTQQESLRNDRMKTLLVNRNDNENNERDDNDGILKIREEQCDNKTEEDDDEDDDLSTVSGNGNCNGINARGIIDKNTTTTTTTRTNRNHSPPVSFVTTTTNTAVNNDDEDEDEDGNVIAAIAAATTATNNNNNDDDDDDDDDEDATVDVVPPKGEQGTDTIPADNNRTDKHDDDDSDDDSDDDDDTVQDYFTQQQQQQQGPIPTITLLSTQPLATQPEDDQDEEEEEDGDETECAVVAQPVAGTSQLLLSISFDINDDDGKEDENNDDKDKDNGYNDNNNGGNMDQDTKQKEKSEGCILGKDSNNDAATTTYSDIEEESTQIPTPTKKMAETTTTTTTTQETTSKKDGSCTTQNSNETMMMTMSPSLMRATGEAIFPTDTSSSYCDEDKEEVEEEKEKNTICTKATSTNSYPAVDDDDTQATVCNNTEKSYELLAHLPKAGTHSVTKSTQRTNNEDESKIVDVEEEEDAEVDNNDESKILSFTAGEKEKETDLGENNECSTFSTAGDDTQYAVCEMQTQNNNQQSKIVDKGEEKVKLDIKDPINMMTNVREEEDENAETDIGEDNESSIPTTAVDGTQAAVCDATTKSNVLELMNVPERDEADEETVGGGENYETSVRITIVDGTQAAVCKTQTLNDDNKEESKNVGKEDEVQVDRDNENESKMPSSLENVGKDEGVKRDNTDQSKMTIREEDAETEVGEEDEPSFPNADASVGIDFDGDADDTPGIDFDGDFDGDADDTQGAVCDTLNKQDPEIVCNATEKVATESNIHPKRAKPSEILGDDANEWTSSQHPSKMCAHQSEFKTNAFRKRKHVEEEDSSIQEQAPASARSSRRKREPAKSETLSLVSTSSARKTRGKGSRRATGNEEVEKIVITRNKSETTSARRSTRQREPTASSSGSNTARKTPEKEFEFGADDNHEDEVVNDDEIVRYRSPSKRKSLTYSKRDAIGKVASSKIDPVKGRVSDSKKNRKVAASAPGGRSSAKRRQVSPKHDDDGGNSKSTTADADERYQKMFAFAIKKNVINIVTSSVLEKDATLIEAFCKKSLNSGSGGIKFVLKDAVDTTTTVCITPANKKDEASQRTLKAIRSSLLGIPMVDPQWIKACKKEGNVVIPTRFVRSLPAKIGKISMIGAKDGVAKLAAIWNDNKFNLYNSNNNDSASPNLLFHSTDVFLYGSYPPEKKNSLIRLLKDGSANIISTSKDVSLQLKSIVDSSSSSRTDESKYDCSTNDKRKFVLLCGDRGGKALPKYVLTEIKDALESDAEASKFIYVVDSNWVSLSIACAKMLSPTNFKPTSSAIDLWN